MNSKLAPIDDRVIEQLHSYIARQEWNELFLHGGCYHFAKTINARYSLPFRKGDKFGVHVWCVTQDGEAVDFNGINSEEEAFKLAIPGASTVPGQPSMTDLSEEEVEDHLKRFPPDLSEEMLKIAESIIKSEKRFRSLSSTL